MKLDWWWVLIALSAGACFGVVLQGAIIAMSDAMKGERE